MRKCYAFFLLISTLVNAQQDALLTKISRNSTSIIDDFFDPSLAPFYHGVASGDPTESAVIIWTRITTNTPSALVNWKVATDPTMLNVVKNGKFTTDDAIDFTVKVDVTDLNPNTSYYYQFETSDQYSIIGKTRTAPIGNVSNVRFGVVSCSNFQNGYFNGYQELANRKDIDAVLHLGDYIYEYESGGYGYDSSIGREHLPANEIITLADYRVRYSYYRLDAMLRNLHQQHPFILIWDDHEFSNDANMNGAENHDPVTEGSWNDRKNNAYKAYFEWMPVRANTIEEYRLYRTFSYGDLLDLIMLDTRIQGRDEVITAKISSMTKKERKTIIKSLIKSTSLNTIEDIKATLIQVTPLFLDKDKITNEEYELVLNTFTKLAYDYKLYGYKNNISGIAKEKLEAILQKASLDVSVKNNSTFSTNATYTSILGIEQYNWLINELGTSTATWRIIGNQVMMMPYNGVTTDDAWDGYPEERNSLLQYINDNNIKNNVVLTGDIHSMFTGIVEHDNICQAVEFIVPSITSENLDVYGGVATWLAESWTFVNNWHMYDVSLDAHGYYILDVKNDRVQADWYNMNDITTPNSGQTYFKSWYTDKDNCNLVESKTPSEPLLSYGDFPKSINNNNITKDYVIIGVYPNPVYQIGNIHYVINKSTLMNITIYDANGGKIMDLLKNKLHYKGVYNLSFNVEDLRSGVYFLKVSSVDQVYNKKILVK